MKFFRFPTKERVLKINKTEITRENAFNGDLIDIEDNHEYSKDQKSWF